MGALQAIQENGLEIVGVAGTSAGALAAVLTAIGLEAGDVMDASNPGKHILAPMTPVQLLGQDEWTRLGWLRHFGKWAGLAGLLGGIPLASIVSPCNAGTAIHIFRHIGLFSTENIRKFINTTIRNRLVEINRIADLRRDIPEDITFAVLAQEWPTVIPLKIVATDVDQGTLELFDAHRTPDVVVAEAVAASISIPIAFRPALIPSYRPGRFADGGMVANLPIWAFAEDKLAYEREHYASPPVPTVGVLEPGDRGAPTRLRPLDQLAFGGRHRGGAVTPVERLLDLADVVSEGLGLGQKVPRPIHLLLQGLERRIGQARQIPRVVDQAGRFVLERLDLIVDLLERARRLDDALDMAGGVIDGDLGLRGRRKGGEGRGAGQ